MYLKKEVFREIVKFTPLISIDLIIKEANGRVLLGQRVNEPAQGKWFVPGGRILKDVPIKDAFEGILQNEVGIQVPFERAVFLGVYEHIYNTNFAGEQGYGTHYVVLAYEVNIESMPLDILPCGQHVVWQWFTKEEINRNGDVHQNTKNYFLD